MIREVKINSRVGDNPEDGNIMIIAIQNPLNRIVVEVNFFGTTPVSSQTVCCQHCKYGLLNFKPTQTPKLTMEQQY